MLLTCGHVPAGESADQRGRLGGGLPAADRELGRQGDPQLRAGRPGRPRGAGPAGGVDLPVADPGASRGRSRRRSGEVEIVASRWLVAHGRWIGCGSGWARRGDPAGGGWTPRWPSGSPSTSSRAPPPERLPQVALVGRLRQMALRPDRGREGALRLRLRRLPSDPPYGADRLLVPSR